MSLNTIADTIHAHISDGANVSTPGPIDVTATDTPTINSLAGGVAGAALVALGAALATNHLSATVRAYVDDARAASSASAITVSATSTSTIETLTVGGAAAGTVALAGSVSLNNIANTVDTRSVSNNANLLAFGSVNVAASDTPTIEALAPAVAVAGAVACGASVATNDIASTITAYIDHSTVVSGAIMSPEGTGGPAGSVEVSAISMPTLSTMTLGGSDAAIFAAGGSVTTMTLANTVDAYIANSSNVQAGGSIGVTAQSTSSVDLEAGAFSGAIAQAGAGVATATLSDQTSAYVTSSSQLSAGDAVQVAANSDLSSCQVNAYVGGLGIVGLDAASATLTSSNNASAYIAGGAAVNHAGSVQVTAETTSPLNAKAYGRNRWAGFRRQGRLAGHGERPDPGLYRWRDDRRCGGRRCVGDRRQHRRQSHRLGQRDRHGRCELLGRRRRHRGGEAETRQRPA